MADATPHYQEDAQDSAFTRLLIEVPGDLTKEDYIEANLLYQREKGKKSANWLIPLYCVLGACFCGCVIISFMAGMNRTGWLLIGMFILCTLGIGYIFWLQRCLIRRRAEKIYENSMLLKEGRNLAFYEHFVEGCSYTGMERRLWTEFDGGAENEKVMILYYGSVMMVVPSRAVDSGASIYLSGLFANRLEEKYHKRACLQAFGKPIPPPEPIEVKKEDISFVHQKKEAGPCFYFHQGVAEAWREIRGKVLFYCSVCSLIFSMFLTVFFYSGLDGRLFSVQTLLWFLLLFAGIGGFLYLLLSVRYRKEIKNTLGNGEASLHMLEAGIEVVTRNKSSFVPWTLLNGLVERDTYFVLKYDRYYRLYIPKEGLYVLSSDKKEKNDAVAQLKKLINHRQPPISDR